MATQARGDRGLPFRLPNRTLAPSDGGSRPPYVDPDLDPSLLLGLDRPEIAASLADSAARGYTAVFLNVVDTRFRGDDPVNRYGDSPFRIPRIYWSVPDYIRQADFSTPRDAFFDLFAYFLQEAATRGMRVVAAPLRAAADDESDGWSRAMQANGPGRMRLYGNYLGRRFGAYANISWTWDSSAHVPIDALMRELIAGIDEATTPREFAPGDGARPAASRREP
ncbi:MAG TPA: DUF4038 domain-containing protein [Woeseiaceae bacterium]|nr:DUF4038 domain-containing protein [Woeseiaceae bacterium]